MNKRQRKKMMKKRYWYGFDLSSQPDQTVYIPDTVLHHLYTKLHQQLNDVGFLDRIEHNILYGTGTEKPVGMFTERERWFIDKKRTGAIFKAAIRNINT